MILEMVNKIGMQIYIKISYLYRKDDAKYYLKLNLGLNLILKHWRKV